MGGLKNMWAKILVIALLGFLASPVSHADVTDSAANGFTVRIEENVHATPAYAYNRLVHNVGD